MRFFMTFHSRMFPEAPKMQAWRCGCGRIIFKGNTENIVVANDIGVPWEAFEPGQQMIEIQCHSCKNLYRILFQ
jgi:hypothetical protein